MSFLTSNSENNNNVWNSQYVDSHSSSLYGFSFDNNNNAALFGSGGTNPKQRFTEFNSAGFHQQQQQPATNYGNGYYNLPYGASLSKSLATHSPVLLPSVSSAAAHDIFKQFHLSGNTTAAGTNSMLHGGRQHQHQSQTQQATPTPLYNWMSSTLQLHQSTTTASTNANSTSNASITTTSTATSVKNVAKATVNFVENNHLDTAGLLLDRTLTKNSLLHNNNSAEVILGRTPSEILKQKVLFKIQSDLDHEKNLKKNIIDDLIHVSDPRGVVDYLYKSCSGEPYGGGSKPQKKEKIAERDDQRNKASLTYIAKAAANISKKKMEHQTTQTKMKKIYASAAAAGGRVSSNSSSCQNEKQHQQQPQQPSLAPSSHHHHVSNTNSGASSHASASASLFQNSTNSSNFSSNSTSTKQSPKKESWFSSSYTTGSECSSSDNESVRSRDSNHNTMVNIPAQELIPDYRSNNHSRRPKFQSLCSRFVQGSCNNHRCKYLHAKPLVAHRDQIIFLGGLPKDVDRTTLYNELLRNNIPVINLPMVIDRFTPRVVLENKSIAKRYVDMRTVTLFGKQVDVRPYKQSSEVHQIFLGGLHSKTEVQDIDRALRDLNCTLMNVPTINKGYSINVEVSSKNEQKLLLNRGTITILGKRVEIKPINKRKRKHHNRRRHNN